MGLEMPDFVIRYYMEGDYDEVSGSWYEGNHGMLLVRGTYEDARLRVEEFAAKYRTRVRDASIDPVSDEERRTGEISAYG